MKRNIIAVLAIVMVLCCVTLAACNDKNTTDVLDNYICDIDGTTVSADFTLPAKIGGESVEWKSDKENISLQNRGEDWLAKVSFPESGEVEVTLTVSVKNASKSYKVRVKALDVYDFMNNYTFPKDKATVVENFALEREFTYAGKKATIAWSVDQEYELYIKVSEDGNTLEVTPQGTQTEVRVKATFTYGGVSAPQSYRMTVYKEMKGLELVNYWYTNTGVSIDMSGYVVEIATEYSESYGNVSLYMVNDEKTAGYYLYRVKLANASDAAKLKPGVHITVTGTTNQNYNGLIETNAGGSLVVDADKPAIDVNTTVYAIDQEILGNLPTTVYNESRLVSLSNWKVKSVAADSDKKASDNFTILTLTKGDVDVALRVSKYMEGAYKTTADDATWTALCGLTTTYPVGTMVNATGILSQYKGAWQILLANASAVTASGKEEDAEDTTYAGKQVAAAIEEVNAKLVDLNINTKEGKTVRIQEAKEFDLLTASGDVTVKYEVVGATNAVVIDGGKMTVTPGNPETTTILATYTVGDFSANQFIFVESLVPTAASMLEDLAIEKKINAVTDLPVAPEGATITWKVVSGEGSIAIKDGQLIPTLKENDVATIINATLTYKEVTRNKDYVVIVKAGKGAEMVDGSFEEGKGYVLALNQNNLGKTLYAINEVDGNYLKSTDNSDNAQLVYVEKDGEDGYKLYFLDSKGNKSYIGYKIEKNDKNKDTPYITLVSEDAPAWKWDSEKKCFSCDITIGTTTEAYYFGTYNTFETLSLSKVSYVSTSFPAFLGNIVFAPLAERTITADAPNATVELSATKGYDGQKFTFTVEVEEGFELVSVKVNGTAVEAVDGVYTATIKGATTVAVATKEQGSEDANIKTVPQAKELADGSDVVVTGYVKTIAAKDAWSDKYNNMSVTIADAEGNELYVYRLATKVELNDVIIVTGKVGSYNNAKQIAAGATAIIVGTNTAE